MVVAAPWPMSMMFALIFPKNDLHAFSLSLALPHSWLIMGTNHSKRVKDLSRCKEQEWEYVNRREVFK